ncbi:unnamed protein product [Protopolystoma xenopodis]|uniref:Uncharacterized protein n=1 Tax=Protopolystoma xenopodis TaxID=117903 RepID=A0A3S5ADJ6_9PLAT|nr:unnamed protein product [Protopolystoma xenopodis]
MCVCVCVCLSVCSVNNQPPGPSGEWNEGEAKKSCLNAVAVSSSPVRVKPKMILWSVLGRMLHSPRPSVLMRPTRGRAFRRSCRPGRLYSSLMSFQLEGKWRTCFLVQNGQFIEAAKKPSQHNWPITNEDPSGTIEWADWIQHHLTGRAHLELALRDRLDSQDPVQEGLGTTFGYSRQSVCSLSLSLSLFHSLVPFVRLTTLISKIGSQVRRELICRLTTWKRWMKRMPLAYT